MSCGLDTPLFCETPSLVAETASTEGAKVLYTHVLREGEYLIEEYLLRRFGIAIRAGNIPGKLSQATAVSFLEP